MPHRPARASRERIVVLRTFSKCHGLAGLRVGCLFAPRPLIECLERARLPFSVNVLSQIAAATSLQDTHHIRTSRQRNRVQMDRLIPELLALGCGVTPSQANFLLVDFRCENVVGALLEHGVQVRSMAAYGLPTSARITIGTRRQNQTLLQTLCLVLTGTALASCELPRAA